MTTFLSDQSEEPKRIVLVGAGKFGRHWVNRLQQSPKAHLVGVVDKNTDAIKALRMEGISVASELKPMLDFVHHDGVVICTNPHSHVELSLQALEAGKHVMCAKPGVTSMADYEMIATVAKDKDADYSIDYTMLSAPEVNFLDVSFCTWGEPYGIETSRFVIGNPDPIGEVLDLMSHDVALAQYHVPDFERADVVTCWRDVRGYIKASVCCGENRIGYFKAGYDSKRPKKICAFEVRQNKKVIEPVGMIVWNQNERFLLFEKANGRAYRVDFEEWPDPITLSIERFVRRIKQKESGATDYFNDMVLQSAHIGERPIRTTVRILEAMTQSLQNHGEPVRL